MDIQTRKLEFIQEFLKIQNEDVIKRFENILQNETKFPEDNDLKKLTINEFNARIDRSMEDSNEDRLIESVDLLTEIKKWT